MPYAYWTKTPPWHEKDSNSSSSTVRIWIPDYFIFKWSKVVWLSNSPAFRPLLNTRLVKVQYLDDYVIEMSCFISPLYLGHKRHLNTGVKVQNLYAIQNWKSSLIIVMHNSSLSEMYFFLLKGCLRNGACKLLLWLSKSSRCWIIFQGGKV